MSERESVTNRRSGEMILPSVMRRANFAGRMRGLIGWRRLPKGVGLHCVSAHRSRFGCAVHTLGMRFPIAVIWLDEAGIVVDTRRAEPWRPLFMPKTPARSYIEAHAALLDRVAIGDQLIFDTESN